MKIVTQFLLAIIIVGLSFMSSAAQEDLTTEEQAYVVLEQVITSINSLKLPENRSRLAIVAADLLWKRDSARARSLFLQAADDIAELERLSDGKHNEPFNRSQSSTELRQKLILTAGQHEAVLAYELFHKTQPPKTQLAEAGGTGNETYIEQLLLAQLTRVDPKFALSKAEELLDREIYSPAITSVLAQLQQQDERAATQLTEKILGSLRANNLLNSYDAISLTLELLRAGPRTSEPSRPDGGMVQLSASAYQRLLETATVALLKVSPTQSAESTKPVAQQNARDLLLNLRPLLPQIERYVPGSYRALRQKMNEINNSHAGFADLTYLTPQGAANNLLNAASTAPPAVRGQLYQQAALKAVDEGNWESARQIANDHLDSDMRTAVFLRIAAHEQVRKEKAGQTDDLRQSLAETTSDSDRLRLLLQLAQRTKSDNPEYSAQKLNEAYVLVAGRATNYEQLQNRLQVTRALAAVDPARTLELLQLGIDQLNELVSAAATLNGFEVDMFVSNEMPLPGNHQLGAMLVQYGDGLALLAKSDFRRAVATAERFQSPEATLLARLSIVQSALDECCE